VPDLRGAYLRGAGASAAGWGAAGNLPGARQEDSTALPKVNFTGQANNDGAHTHTSVVAPNRGSGGGVTWDGGNIGASPPNTGVSGAHTHTVTVNGGGDLETRPKSVFVDWIIKCSDFTVTLVP